MTFFEFDAYTISLIAIVVVGCGSILFGAYRLRRP